MLETTYEVSQSGKSISCEKIAINKYENKITRLHFNFDSTIISSRKYTALLNPVTQTYKISPIGLDDSVLLSTEMSRYPGVWQLILIATVDDYEITNNDIDQSKCTYVSNTAKFIVVRDNFLSDKTIEQEDSPAIQQLIDETVAMRDTLEQYALSANEDYNKAASAAETVLDVQKDITQLKDDIFAAVKDMEIWEKVIVTDGTGEKYLADDGQYKDIPETTIEDTELYAMLEEVFAD